MAAGDFIFQLVFVLAHNLLRCLVDLVQMFLGLERGERESVLKVGLDVQERDWREVLRREFRPGGSSWANLLEEALEDGAKRLLLPSISREIRRDLTEQAQLHAIGVFGENLKSLLLVPPLDGHTVLGLDPRISIWL